MGREEVLAAVHAALVGVIAPPLAPARTADASVADLATLAARFVNAARAVGTVVHEAASRAAAVDTVVTILAAAGGAPRVAAWALAPASAIAAAAVASLPGATLHLVDAATSVADVAAADVGVTGADVLVAESGTLVLRSHSRARAVSLLPPVHVAIVGRARLVGDLGTALARVRVDGEPDSCLTLITGPSRTADIEKKLVVGVHGPCALHVVLLASEEH